MYFPYLRGRQNELLALRELANENLLGNYVIPIVEPVKLSATFIKTVKTFVEKNQRIAIIHNPSVGSFSSDMNDAEKDSYKAEFAELFNNDNVIKSHIINERSQMQLNSMHRRGIEKKDWLVVVNNRDNFGIYEKTFGDIYPQFVLMPDESAFRRKIKCHRVLLDDKFEKQVRNADYQHVSDEFFSDDHLYFKDDGFTGFSDYSVIGESYLEGGFAPYAVAIHIVYFTSDASLKVKHFVSDSNQDSKDPAKKFYEAVDKLANWYKTEPFKKTLGLATLLEHYNNETYPGLGSIKKLSVMHHLELMGKFLSEGF